MPIVKSNPPSIAPPVGRYSHLAVIPAGSDILVLAGQVGVDADGTLPDSVDAQFQNALSNALAILRSEGLGAEALVKVNIWLVRSVEREAFLKHWNEFTNYPPPPTTVGYVAGLVRPEYLVEVEVWAARPCAP